VHNGVSVHSNKYLLSPHSSLDVHLRVFCPWRAPASSSRSTGSRARGLSPPWPRQRGRRRPVAHREITIVKPLCLFLSLSLPFFITAFCVPILPFHCVFAFFFAAPLCCFGLVGNCCDAWTLLPCVGSPFSFCSHHRGTNYILSCPFLPFFPSDLCVRDVQTNVFPLSLAHSLEQIIVVSVAV
jgi:hypothetical protein